MKTVIASCVLMLTPFGQIQTSANDIFDELLKATEDRIRAIYQRGEFRARGTDARWLPDSSGYTVTELDDGKRKRFYYDLKTGQRKLAGSIPAGKRNAPSKNSKFVLVRNGNLYVRDRKSGNVSQVTKRSTEQQSPDISLRSARLSPDEKWIAFIERDQSKIKVRSMLVPSDPTYPGVRTMKFARVGETIPSLRVGIANVTTGKIQWYDLKDDSNDGFYLGQFEWAASGNELLVERQSRFRDTREFILINPKQAKQKTLYKETNDAWAISSQGKNSGLIWVDDGKGFIVISEKDGWRHARLYSADGKASLLLTPGEYDLIARAAVDEEAGWFYFYASPENATQKHLYRVKLDGTGMAQRVTPADQPGTHDYRFSPDAKWAFHTYSTFDRPPEIDVVRLADHKTLRVLEDNAPLREKMESVIKHPTEFFTIKVDADLEMDAWMIKPSNFDSSKKYPVFVYVYGEPHAQTVLNDWGISHSEFHRTVADMGYLVISIDNRGTPAPKGAAWRRSIFGSLGPLSTKDQAAALNALGKSRAYVDLSRVGIWGWSGGGSNTLNALFRKPDVYHLGIAVVPKPQPQLYNAWFQEIYMRTPKVNPEGYERSAPIRFAEGLKGDLLIVTGSGETNTHVQIVEGLVDRLIELGKPFDYMNYPNRNHGMREGRGTPVHLRMLMARYLVNHLKPGGVAIE